ADAACGAGNDGDFSRHIEQAHVSLPDLIPTVAPVFVFRPNVIPGGPQDRTRNDTLSQLGLRHDFRARGLVHGGVRWICDPWLLVDHRKPPAGVTTACEMVEP